jgi:predicted AAA+ superfamily ATPase
MIARIHSKALLETALSRSRITLVIGPRQCGKTTMARQFVPSGSANYFDLEDPVSLARLEEPMTALAPLTGLVVIDEVQRRPELFPVLRVLADRQPLPARFLILGSAAPELLRQSSESLAGRMEIVAMSGFTLSEVGIEQQSRHWLRGGFPCSYLAASDNDSFAWLKSFTITLVERDIPQLGIGVPAAMLIRFWTMLAHCHGQIWNAAPPARSLGVSEPTVRRYLDLLEGVFMVRQLQPWHANLKKRQVKSPKVYFRDTGVLHHLLGIRSERELLNHPACGASWEGYAIEEAIRVVSPDEAYFWATHNGAELDLLLVKNGLRIGIECKRSDAPRLTPSMRTSLTDLELDRLVVIYPGIRRYSLAEGVEVLPLVELAGLLG